MMRTFALVLALGVAACDGGMSAEDRAAANARAVSEVEANQEPPPETVRPQPILYPDIEKHALYGAGCNFVPEGGGLGAIILAMADAAAIKVDGKVMRLAADKGSAPNPLGSWRKYDGREFSLTLDIDQRAADAVGMESVNYPARAALRDGRDRIVFEGRGTTQCGS